MTDGSVPFGPLQPSASDPSLTPFRRLAEPYIIEKATPRSQALGLLAVFGPMRREDLNRAWADDATLATLVDQAMIEHIHWKGVDWYQLVVHWVPTEEEIDP